MSDPVAEAVDRAEAAGWIHRQHAEAGAREVLGPIREQMAAIKASYDRVHSHMLKSETAAESSRHASELAGIMLAYNAIAPLVYTAEEMAQ